MKLRKNTLFPIRFEYLGALSDCGVSQSHIDAVFDELEQIRKDVLESIHSEGPSREFLFVGHPERSLREYAASRSNSELGRVFKRANRFHSLVDRVVVLGDGNACTGAKAILDTCCQPFWNELSRADRGCKPRIYFEGDSLDNDSLQALLHLLDVHKEKTVTDELDRWAILVIRSRETSHPVSAAVAASSHLYAALQKSVGNDQSQLAELCVEVILDSERSHEESRAKPRDESFSILGGPPGPFSLFTPVGLLPAAFLGVNVMELLTGAMHMSEHFASTIPSENIVFQLIAFNRLLQENTGSKIRKLNLWSKSLLSFGRWVEQFTEEHSSMFLDAQVPPVSIRFGLSPSANCDSNGNRNWRENWAETVVNIVTEQWRFDTLPLDPNCAPAKTFTEAVRDHLVFENQICPASNLILPKIDELHMGQLFQLFMLAAMMESRLLRSSSATQ